MLKELIITIGALFKAHECIIKNKLLKWILFAGILYFCMFCFGIYFYFKTVNIFISWFYQATNVNKLLSFNDNFFGFIITMESFSIYFILLLMYFALIKYIFFWLLTPLLIYFQCKVQSILSENKFPFTYDLFIHSYKFISLAFIRLISIQTFYLVLLLFLTFIPILGWFIPFLALIIECFYAGAILNLYSFGVMRKKLTYTFSYFNIYSGMNIGTGIVFYFIHFIPILGWMTAPFYALVSSKISIDIFNEDK